MIEIIGWILCVYLVVKACELIAMPTINGLGRNFALFGALIAIIAAPIFVYLLDLQANSGASSLSSVQSYSECMRQAQTLDEMSRCKP